MRAIGHSVYSNLPTQTQHFHPHMRRGSITFFVLLGEGFKERAGNKAPTKKPSSLQLGEMC